MSTSFVHKPRVAWDLARATLAMAGAADEHFRWFGHEVERRLGWDMASELHKTRERLVRNERLDVHEVELGRWRARIEDLLAQNPRMTETLVELRTEANARLAG
jgi:hypothetical protein